MVKAGEEVCHLISAEPCGSAASNIPNTVRVKVVSISGISILVNMILNLSSGLRTVTAPIMEVVVEKVMYKFGPTCI